MRRHLPMTLFLLAALAVPVGLFASGGEPPAAEKAGQPESHEAAKPASPTEGAGAHGAKPEATASPTPVPWTLGPPLAGKFDLTTLRALTRVRRFRYAELGEIREMMGLTRPQPFRFEVVVEFGGESGMAELQKRASLVREDLRKLVAHYTPLELRHPSGRERLREECIFAINRRLETARVRQLYFTQYFVGYGG